MPEITQAVTINRPINEVFRFTIEFEKAADYIPDVTGSFLTGDKARVGAMLTQNRTTRALGWKLDLNADIVGYQPNRLIEYKGVIGRFPAHGRIEFESAGTSTTVRENVNIRMGFLFAIFGPFVRAAMSRRTNRALNALKERLESRTGTSDAIPTDFHNQL